MKYDDDRLNDIYDRTDGHCHICHKKLSFSNYGKHGKRGSWHVEHSKPKIKGGTDRLNNLYPACIKCNLDKGTKHTKTARSRNGQTRAPYSASKKQKLRDNNIGKGVLIGGALGAFLGPLGAVIGATIGGALGSSSSPKK